MSEALEPPEDVVSSRLTAAVGGVATALAELAAAASGYLWQEADDALLGGLLELHRLANVQDSVVHRLVREIDCRGAATRTGAPSTAAFLRERLHLHPGAAKRCVVTARGLHDDPSGALVHHLDPDEKSGAAGRPVLAAAFSTGAISGEHAAVAVRVLAELPGELADDVVAEAECYLATEAARRDPAQLTRLGRHLSHVLDPDRGDRLDDEPGPRDRQHLALRPRRDGGADVHGRLSPETTAALLAQLQPLAAPKPTTDGRPDLRTPDQRSADALQELLRRHSAADLGATSHGAKATISVTMCLDTLEKRLGAPAATLGWAGPVSAETARRLACDAQVIPVLLGSRGEPLDVGRASYPVTRAIWRALVARDGGCGFDTCGRPPEWTEAHHLIFWADGGETSTDNCALFCDHHHRVVHHDGWAAQLIDGVVHVTPPPWIDPEQTPRPNQNPHRAGGTADLFRRDPPEPEPPVPRREPPDPDPPDARRGIRSRSARPRGGAIRSRSARPRGGAIRSRAPDPPDREADRSGPLQW